MAVRIPDSPRNCGGDFRKVVDSFLSCDGLPFAKILSAERIARVFAKHGSLFGMDSVYSTAVTLWAFLSQVLRDGKQASCQAAVARIVSYCKCTGQHAPTQDTGDYCRARAKLSEHALHDLSCELAEETEQASSKWFWKGLRVNLLDGFTFTMPDTLENQEVYPQQKGQKPGVGLPIARAVTLVSAATACVIDLALGPYGGKATSELALLKSMLKSLPEDSIAVADRFYCCFMMVGLLVNQNTHICMRKHGSRHSDFRRGKRLGKYDHIITWKLSPRPTWIDKATYALIPRTLTLREIRYNIVRPGRRTRTIDIITTLLDPEEYSKEDIATLYGLRWNAELDIRSIKSNLNLGHVRCKKPEMVRREVWTTILAYNLIRITAAGAALLHGKQPRQISFTSTCQYVLASWMLLSAEMIDRQSLQNYLLLMLEQIAECEVANRPGRVEPRVLKRRRHRYPLMRKRRNQLRAELRKKCT